MKRNKSLHNRLFAVVLAMVMVLTLVPSASALADETDETVATETTVVEPKEESEETPWAVEDQDDSESAEAGVTQKTPDAQETLGKEEKSEETVEVIENSETETISHKAAKAQTNGADITSAILTELTVSEDAVEHGAKVIVRGKFSDHTDDADSSNDVLIGNGSVLHVTWENGATALITATPHTERLKIKGVECATLHVTKEEATITFDDDFESKNLTNISGSFNFTANLTNSQQDNTDDVFIKGGTITKKISVHRGVETGTRFSAKNGGESDSQENELNYVIHINMPHFDVDGPVTLTDTLPDGITLKEGSDYLYFRKFQADGTEIGFYGNYSLSKFEEGADGKIPVGTTHSINGKTITITFPENVVDYTEISFNYTCTIDDDYKDTWKSFDNSVEVSYKYPDSEERVNEPSNWTIQRSLAGGDITGTPKGTLRVTKLVKGTSAPVQGLTFAVTKEGDESFYKTMTTGKDGTAKLENLLPGKYIVKEQSAPGWIELDAANQEVTFLEDDTEGHTLTFEDDVKTKPVSFTKVWEDQGNAYDSRPTADEFVRLVHLYKGNEEVINVTPIVTDNNNGTYTVAYNNLDAYSQDGTEIDYSLKEDAVDGYQADQQSVEEGKKLTNTLNTGNIAFNPTQITLEKIDSESKEVLASAEFTVTAPDQSTKKYTTDQNGKAEISLTQEGTYSIEESKAPTGYTGASVKAQVTVVRGNGTKAMDPDTKKPIDTYDLVVTSANVVNGTLTVENDKITDAAAEYEKVILTKKNAEGTVLQNATFSVFEDAKCEGKVVTTYTAGMAFISSRDEAFKDLLPEAGKRVTLYVKETEAPEGYNLSQDVHELVISASAKSAWNEDHTKYVTTTVYALNIDGRQEATVIDDLTERLVSFDKVDENHQSVKGAVLSVRDLNNTEKGKGVVDTWTTDGSAHTVALTAGQYELVEEPAPTGFTLADPIGFTVALNGEITRLDGQTDDLPVIVMTDALEKGSKDQAFAKIDRYGRPVAGAEMEICSLEGNLIASWTTDGELHTEKLVEGTYVLTEVSAPEGYLVADPIEFVIDENGDLVEGQTELKNCDADLAMVDAFDEEFSVTISKQDEDGKKVAGAELQILDEDENVLETFVSDKNKDQKFNLPKGRYVLHEVSAPEGYELAEDLAFSVDEEGELTVSGDAENGKDGVVVMVDKKTPTPPEEPGKPNQPENPKNPKNPKNSKNPKEQGAKKTSTKSRSAKTGDSSNVVIWSGLLVLAMAAAMVVGYLKRKEL